MTTTLAYPQRAGTVVEPLRRPHDCRPPAAKAAPPGREADILEGARRLICEGAGATPALQRAVVGDCLREARAGASPRDRVEAAAALLALADRLGAGTLSLERTPAKQVMRAYRTLTELPTSLIEGQACEAFDLTDDEIEAAVGGEPREQLALTVALGLWRMSDSRQSAGELRAEARDNLGDNWRKLTC